MTVIVVVVTYLSTYCGLVEVQPNVACITNNTASYESGNTVIKVLVHWLHVFDQCRTHSALYFGLCV